MPIPVGSLGDQLELPGFPQTDPLFKLDPVRAPVPRRQVHYELFFGLFPEPDDAKRFASVAAELRLLHGLLGPPHLPGRRHITLHGLGAFLGSVPSALIDAVSVAASRVACPSLDIAFTEVLSFAPSGAFVMRPDTKSDAGIKSLSQLLALELR